eukprot:scaffold82699_cov35-Tisochrysis_lutea.AAC.3
MCHVLTDRCHPFVAVRIVSSNQKEVAVRYLNCRHTIQGCVMMMKQDGHEYDGLSSIHKQASRAHQ